MIKQTFATLALPALCAFTLLPLSAFGQNPAGQENRATVIKPAHADTTSRPLREMVETTLPTTPRGGRDFEPGRPQPVGNSNPSFIDPLAAKGSGSIAASVSPAASTTGVPVDPNRRVAPPDTTGDLGPNHYVQWVNLRYAIYTLSRDATTRAITGFNLVPGFPKNGNVIWSGFSDADCATNNDGDPIVQYDQFADRWVLTQFSVSTTPYKQCVAVSTSPDPTGTYNRYSYSFDTNFNDFPKMGVWSDGYYITYNMFRRGRTFIGTNVCAFERAKMLTGDPSARQICTLTANGASLEPADIEGSTLPAAGTGNPLLSITSTALNFWRYSVNWTAGTATLTGPTAVAGVAAFSRACGGGTCIPQPGTTQQLDSLGDRLNYRLSYRNFSTRESLLINHAVATNNVTGIRWYELRNASGQTISSATPVIYQQGTFAPTADFRWMGSAAMDKTGGIGIGYNISNASTIQPSIRYAVRGAADTLGTLGGETQILVGTGSQQANLARWGDYSTLSVDPIDGCTMVFTTEYLPANGTFNWSTYISSFKLSTCQ